MIEQKVFTLSGVPGSGTTTIAELLSKKLQLRIVNTGEVFRELAEEYEMELAEFGKYAEENLDIDQELDKRQLVYARKGDVILEGRLAGWLTKANNVEAFKILLTADLDTRIKRIMGREGKSYDEVRVDILERERCELERFMRLYRADYQDESHYDLIIDTTNLTPEKIVERIFSELNK